MKIKMSNEKDSPLTQTGSIGTIKVTSSDKVFLDDIVNCLKSAFQCEITSPKMYNAEKDVFFLYVSAKRRV